MVDIIIKSFNRPYYLDRCLESIDKYVSGDCKIVVLDDGTPEKYLNKIREKHPRIQILLSKQYPDKIKAVQENLETGKEINGFQIPANSWYDAVKNATQYVMVTEDDVWFTEQANLNDLASQMNEYGIDLLKLGWLGNAKMKTSENDAELSDELNAENLHGIFTSNQFIMDLFMYNKFKFFSLLYRLGIVNNQTKRKYWALNSILMGLWRKDYWLFVWKDSKGKTDEKQQLRNAAVWLHKNKSNPNMVAKAKTNYLKTTFQSSATNSYHKYGFDFDVNYFNHVINEAWYKDRFNPMQNFPKDFSPEYFDQFLDENINKAEYHKWVEKFKNQYRALGIEIE